MKYLILFVSIVIFASCDQSTAKTNKKTLSSNQKNLTTARPKNAIKAPDFTLADLNGNWVTLDDYKGKVVLLNFWGTWCGPCRREIPDFISLIDKYQKNGLEIIGVTLTSGSPDNIQRFSDYMGINYTLLTDIEGQETQSVTMQYGMATGEQINGIPTTFIIDRDGYIVKKYIGPRSESIFYKDIQPYL